MTGQARWEEDNSSSRFENTIPLEKPWRLRKGKSLLLCLLWIYLISFPEWGGGGVMSATLPTKSLGNKDHVSKPNQNVPPRVSSVCSHPHPFTVELMWIKTCDIADTGNCCCKHWLALCCHGTRYCHSYGNDIKIMSLCWLSSNQQNERDCSSQLTLSFSSWPPHINRLMITVKT